MITVQEFFDYFKDVDSHDEEEELTFKEVKRRPIRFFTGPDTEVVVLSVYEDDDTCISVDLGPPSD